MANDKLDSVNLHIQNRQEVIFSEEVEAISSINERGIFDILPKHENFISIIKDFLIIRLKGGGKKEIKIKGGILKAHENEVKIYLDIIE